MKTQCGRTLIEILGALALIGALTFIGVKSYKILYAKHQANEAFESVQCQMLELDLLDLDRIDLGEDITSGACENDSGVEIKVVRTEMEDEDGGEISSGYYVELADLTPEACRQVLSKPWETEFEIAVGCEGRTFNPDEPDYSVCDIFDEDYEPECLEEYIEEDIGEVSLLDNALPSDSIFHKILGISNAYARYDGTTVIYKNGKWIRIYREFFTKVDATCPRELRTAARTCCPKRATPYFNGLFSGCCYTGSDGTYTFDHEDGTLTVYNVLFRIRSDIMVKKDIKEKKDGPSEFVELPLQDCCVRPAIRDIYDANGTFSGTRYCCESYETEGMSPECKKWFDRYGTSFRLFYPAPPECNVDNLEYSGGKSSWDTDSKKLHDQYKAYAEKYTKEHPPFPESKELTNYFYYHFSKDVIQKKEPQPPALVYKEETYKKLYAEYESKKNERSKYERFVDVFGDPDLRYLNDNKAPLVLWKGKISREDLISRYEKWWDKALTDYGIPSEKRKINIGGKLYDTTMSLIHHPNENVTFPYEQKERHSISDDPEIKTVKAKSVFSLIDGFSSFAKSPHHLFIVSNSWNDMIYAWRTCEELDYAYKNCGLDGKYTCNDNYKEALKFNAVALYLHEIGHGVDKLASKRKKPLYINLDGAMHLILTEIRSRLIEYQKLYQIVSANNEMRACVYNYDPAVIDAFFDKLFPPPEQWMTDLGLFQNIDGSPYDPLKSERESMKQFQQEAKNNCKDAYDKIQKFFREIKEEGFMPFERFYDIADKSGIERAMIEAGITILDSDLLSTSNSYGGAAIPKDKEGNELGILQATNIDWDSYIRQFPDDDVMSHAGMREILERSTTFWDWVCSTFSYLNPIQCMERQMANRAVKDGLCCDPDSEKLYCAKWKKEDINNDGKNDKLHCEDGFAMCCPVGSVVAINKDVRNGNLTAECCPAGNVRPTREIYKEDEWDEEGIPLSVCECTDGGDCGPNQFCVTEGWLSGQSDEVKDYFKNKPKNICYKRLSEVGRACAPLGMYGCRTQFGGQYARERCGSEDENTWYKPCPGGTYNDDNTCPMTVDACKKCPKDEPYSHMKTTSKDNCFSCPANAVAPKDYGGTDEIKDSSQWVYASNGEGDCYCETKYYAVNDNKNCCLAGQYWNGEACAEASCPKDTDLYNPSDPTGDMFYAPVSETDPSLDSMRCMCPADKPIHHDDQCKKCSDFVSGAVSDADNVGDLIPLLDWPFSLRTSQVCYCPSTAPIYHDGQCKKCSDFVSGAVSDADNVGEQIPLLDSPLYLSTDQACYCPSTAPVYGYIDGKPICQQCPDGTLFSEDSCVTCYNIDSSKPVYNNGVCEECPDGSGVRSEFDSNGYDGDVICTGDVCMGKQYCYCASGYVWDETAGTCVENETLRMCDYNGDGYADDGILNESDGCDSTEAYCAGKCQSKYNNQSLTGSFDSYAKKCDCDSPYELCNLDDDNSFAGIYIDGECKDCNDLCGGSSGSLVQLNPYKGICQCSDMGAM